MKLLEIFRTEEPVIDKLTFVFDEVDPLTGCNTMLATSEDGHAFNQWTEGKYEEGGDNSHLGESVWPRDNVSLVAAIGERALDGFFARLSIPTQYGRDENGQIIKEEE